MSKTYYEILEILHTASPDEIKKSYRTLSLRYHPDKNSNNNNCDQIKYINEAYSVLSNVKSRSDYDNKLGNVFTNYETDKPRGMSGLYDNSFYAYNGHHIPSNDTCGYNPNIDKYYKNTNPKSIHIVKNITFEQSFNGTKLPINVTRNVIENDEVYDEVETIYIDIPKGIDNNEIIIIKDKGNYDNGLTGPVKIKIKLIPDILFKRKGLDLIYLKNITFKESVCGFSFQLKHLNSKSYTINNETGIIIHNNYTTVINNLGFIKDDALGNLIIEYTINYPEKLDELTIEKLRKIL